MPGAGWGLTTPRPFDAAATVNSSRQLSTKKLGDEKNGRIQWQAVDRLGLLLHRQERCWLACFMKERQEDIRDYRPAMNATLIRPALTRRITRLFRSAKCRGRPHRAGQKPRVVDVVGASRASRE